MCVPARFLLYKKGASSVGNCVSLGLQLARDII